jgi:hypothetical protein
MRHLVWTTTMLALAAAGSAHAGYTPLSYRPGGNSSERNQAEIIGRFFGNGSFNTQNFAKVGDNFVGQNNGAGNYSHLSFIRVEDFAGVNSGSTLAQRTTLGSVLNIHAGTIAGMTDQVWQDGVVQVQAEAKYAGFRQRAGFKYGATDVVASNQILDVTGVGTSGNMAGVVTAVSAPSDGLFTAAQHQQFRLTRSGDGSSYSNNEWSSRVGENGDSFDHMITFQILDATAPNLRRFMVFFDDQGGGGDRDFNDFSMTLTVVPLPAAAWAGLGTLAALGSLSVLRRKRLSRV